MTYRSSVNLNCEPDSAARLIHPNCNRRVESLVDAIRAHPVAF